MRKSLKEKYQQRRTMTSHTLRLENFKLGGKYLIFDLIAFGKNSAIYYGIEEKTKLERVFKFYNLKQLQEMKGFKQKEICKRMSNYEYQIMNKCKSMNILKCLDIYQDRNYKILVFQYCQTSLQQEISNRVDSTISETRAILILKQILSALKDLNFNAKLLHTNLKAEKILVANGIYKLIDFGLPILQNQDQYFKQGEFLVPEIISRKGFNQKAQVWSIGVLFHQILFGSLPQKLTIQNRNFLQQHSRESIYMDSYQNKKTSRQVSEFLRSCLFIDPELRMSLKQIDNHPMFKLLQLKTQTYHQQKEKQPEVQVQNLDEVIQKRHKQIVPSIVLYVDMKEQIYEYDEICQQTFHFGMLRKQVLKELQKQYQRFGESFEIQQIQKTSILSLKSQINTEQTRLYQQYKKYYLECLKVDFIFQNIVKPLQVSQICRQQRYEVELMYLILSTCFASMSRVRLNEINKQHKKQGLNTEYHKLLQQCVRKSTEVLYKQIEKNEKYYGELLTKIENKIGSIISDKLSKLLDKQLVQQKDLYLGGIENCDFLKQQKIRFTQRFFLKYIQKMEKAREEQTSIKKVRAFKYLKNYVKIWEITDKQNVQEKYSSLKSYIEKQILNNNRSIDASQIISKILI